MKFKEVREKGVGELDQLETKARKELSELWLRVRGGQLTETAKIKEARRDIARILTAKRSKTVSQGRES
jgi:ribosomal protein L29